MRVENLAATQLYNTVQKATAPAQQDGSSFSDVLSKALRDMRQTVEGGETAARAAMTGEGDLQGVVEALTATEMALETAVVMRDRVVEAYQEILRMPV